MLAKNNNNNTNNNNNNDNKRHEYYMAENISRSLVQQFSTMPYYYASSICMDQKYKHYIAYTNYKNKILLHPLLARRANDGLVYDQFGWGVW